MAVARVINDSGTPYFADYSGVINVNTVVSLINITVASGTTLKLSHLEISCRFESFIEVLKNGQVIADLRTGAANPSASFNWIPSRKLISGDIIQVNLQKRSGSPDVEVGAHLMGLSAP